MRILSLLLILAIANTVSGQKVNWKKIREADPDAILMDGNRKPTKVLLLGTFHFDYPNLDGHKTDSANFIDVYSPQRQKEIEELAEVIMRFKPTRFYIESRRQDFHDSLYNEYRKGKYKLGRNEIFQLGYRIAGAMGMEKLFCVDAGNFAWDNYQRFPVIDSMWNTNGRDTIRDKYWSRNFNRMYDVGDSLEKTFTILENFLLMAESKTLRRMHGAYLTGGFNTAGNEGPDLLSMWWYNRNLRIFNNIVTTDPTSEDRIVILFGNGHVPIIKHCFESSPEFELVELKSLLK